VFWSISNIWKHVLFHPEYVQVNKIIMLLLVLYGCQTWLRKCSGKFQILMFHKEELRDPYRSPCDAEANNETEPVARAGDKKCKLNFGEETSWNMVTCTTEKQTAR
jgi:hypothetical protein